MCETDLWFGGHNNNKQTHIHINTMAWPDLGAGPSEKQCFHLAKERNIA